MSEAEKTSVWWIRRDLRLRDNRALNAAAKSDFVIPFYNLSQWQSHHSWTGAKRQQFLTASLEALNKNLQTLSSKIIFESTPLLESLEVLYQKSPFSSLHFSQSPDPFGKKQELEVIAFCRKKGINVQMHLDHAISQPTDVYNKQGNVYRVFTPYSKMWLASNFDQCTTRLSRSKLPLPSSLKLSPTSIPTLEHWNLCPISSTSLIVPAGERAARVRMKQAITNILGQYGENRNTPFGQTTSRLSQDLRFGLISIRELVNKVQNTIAQSTPLNRQQSAQTYLSELIWREFYFQILHHFPDVLSHSFNPSFQNLDWPGSSEQLAQWKAGMTGFPIVDAGMRELNATGFMHNRVRMITSMFLTKDLHCHWLDGESYFMQHLLDGEIASNNGGWQWSAGTGADAAPYFRIQNPWTQSKRFDSEANYIKQWIPELQSIPAKKLHECPKGIPLCSDYPLPIVDHATERARTLALFSECKTHYNAHHQ